MSKPLFFDKCCLNCGTKCENVFCDDFCRQGYKNRMIKLFNDTFKQELNYYEINRVSIQEISKNEVGV